VLLSAHGFFPAPEDVFQLTSLRVGVAIIDSHDILVEWLAPSWAGALARHLA